jgi:hypothetical protein
MTDVYFDGDPATESARRHLERVLKEPHSHRRWPWVAASVAALAAWYFWPRKREADAEPRSHESQVSRNR